MRPDEYRGMIESLFGEETLRLDPEAEYDYGGDDVYLVADIFEFRDGKIAKETRYYAQPFDAPEWRAQWTERI